MFFLKTCELGAVHLLCHTGWGWLGVSKSMTHYETLVGGVGGMTNYDVWE